MRNWSSSCEDRVDYYFRDTRGFTYDEVRACMAAGWSDLLDLEGRLKRVQAIRPTPDFEPLAASFKRIKNILKQAEFDTEGSVKRRSARAGPRARALRGAVARHGGQPLETASPHCAPRSTCSSTKCWSMPKMKPSGATG